MRGRRLRDSDPGSESEEAPRGFFPPFHGDGAAEARNKLQSFLFMSCKSQSFLLNLISRQSR